MKHILILIFIILSSIGKNEQYYATPPNKNIIVVTGKITDHYNKCLPNVKILYIERAKIFTSDSSGYYKIAIHENESLEFSYPGLKTKIVKAKSKIIDIKLEKN